MGLQMVSVKNQGLKVRHMKKNKYVCKDCGHVINSLIEQEKEQTKTKIPLWSLCVNPGLTYALSSSLSEQKQCNSCGSRKLIKKEET